MKNKDLYYKILELESNATPDQIKQAYKDLARVWHPDRFLNDPKLQEKAQEKLKEINIAYQQLSSLSTETPVSESITVADEAVSQYKERFRTPDLSKQGRAAPPEGTRRYAQRLGSITAEGHFRQQQELCMSTIGLGTYLGHWDERTDRLYQEAIRRAVELGSNVIDSAINYRFQRSERVIGATLKQLFDSGKSKRDEIIVAT